MHPDAPSMVRMRDDAAFDNVVLRSKLGKAAKKDLDYAIKVVKKLKMETSTMYCSNLGDIKDWQVIAYVLQFTGVFQI